MQVPADRAERHDVRILVIDDDLDLLALCRISLTHDGHDVIEASSGAEGLELCSTCCPDVVLLDLMMPSLDGFDVLRRIREDEATHDLPVVIVSARVGMVDQNHGWRAGGLRAEMLEDRPLRDTEVVRDVLHLRTLIAVGREVPHGALDDAVTLIRAPAATR